MATGVSESLTLIKELDIIRNIVINCLMELLTIDFEDVGFNYYLMDNEDGNLGMDELDLVEFTLMLEEEYDIDIDMDEMEQYFNESTRVSDVALYIHNKLNNTLGSLEELDR